MGQTCLGTQTHSLCHDIAIPGLLLENFAHTYLICHSVSIKVGQALRLPGCPFGHLWLEQVLWLINWWRKHLAAFYFQSVLSCSFFVKWQWQSCILWAYKPGYSLEINLFLILNRFQICSSRSYIIDVKLKKIKQNISFLIVIYLFNLILYLYVQALILQVE